MLTFANIWIDEKVVHVANVGISKKIIKVVKTMRWTIAQFSGEIKCYTQQKINILKHLTKSSLLKDPKWLPTHQMQKDRLIQYQQTNSQLPPSSRGYLPSKTAVTPGLTVVSYGQNGKLIWGFKTTTKLYKCEIQTLKIFSHSALSKIWSQPSTLW